MSESTDGANSSLSKDKSLFALREAIAELTKSYKALLEKLSYTEAKIQVMEMEIAKNKESK